MSNSAMNQIWMKIIAKAWADENFKARLSYGMRSIPLFNFFRLVLLFLALGLISSCLSVMEHRLGLIGKRSYLDGDGCPTALPGVPDNLSGIVWNHDTQTFFAVINSPPTLLEIQPDRTILRHIPLDGFSDTEDIAYLGDSRFAVVEERLGLIRLFTLSAQDETIPVAQSHCIDLESRHPDNKGFESLFYDHTERVLYTMREQSPYELLSVRLDSPGAITSTPLNLDVRDVAAISRDPRGTWWILSEASSCVARAQTHLPPRYFSIPAHTKNFQPEGMTFTAEDRLVVVAEPNYLAAYMLPQN